MNKLMIAVTASFVVAVAGIAGWMALSAPDRYSSPAMINVDGATFGGPFELVDHTGAPRTAADVIDGPTLLYFGYTYCPDICPIDTQVMVEAVDLLAERGIAITPVFVTVDPARDTPEELAYYAEAMHPAMIALTGTEEQVQIAADAYKVYYQRVDVEDSAAGYLMNHTGYTYLMTAPDQIAALFRREFGPEQLAKDIAAVLEKG